MLLASSAKQIDANLSSLAAQIEQQNPDLSVLAARQFRFAIRQTPLEVTISEPREFNVLEEFILRAGVEFEPAPTLQELADLLGLDEVFVKTAAASLVNLEILKVAENGKIAIAPQGQDFFEKGAVSRSHVQSIYAISDPLNQTLTFKFDAVGAESINLPDLAEFVSLDHKISDLADLSIAEIQPPIQASGLGIHVPENGKIVSKCDVIGDDLDIWQIVSVFVLQDAIENKTTIQARQGKQILETASNLLNEVESQQKLLKELCKSTAEDVILEQPEIIPTPKTRKSAAKKKRKEPIE
ncbi:MAG: hypothetical protein JGK17_21645 [Microcoleus sp. PH2017_10_PVI_O_A]|uniref:hypothetical protein n=1 Tax=unclassified Microcoleus TaxID=2642155 RepID=UPI001D3E80B5|nr:MULTISPECIES: hypothetical protein [unclassified Microcoleus]TAE79626.1 MAG: hypothetical protein EAZ83_21015 [Oscillatoriales cyanobacterium]MCC3408142.1 hypothetical protein [Microcoleus sp. PH2017_10_PVI_O_A]MCC3462265.1 hypothetical protein [Microcoleus sp. PH2017_11_PCY_U_A]MCC3480666.1 hypothetical protein [Microcoleus sp. PH2017_12_PCY_D_A]MCC3530616.1 hypothetical protein [Microcoleus sp. PH2017_21_RUC_O_A]